VATASAREELIREPGPEYRPGEPVRVHLVHRERRTTVSDAGAAIEAAGRSPGWREVAERLERELNVNISRRGVVWLPVVPAGPGEAAIVDRIARASARFYNDLLDLEASI
jgi:hypothetical protein